MQVHTLPDGTRLTPYARFWPRLIALFIDWLIAVVIPIVIATFAASSVTRSYGSEPSELEVLLLWLFLLVFFVLGYFTYVWARGKSLGMVVVGVQTINPKTGGPPGVLRAAVRAFLVLVFLACAFLLWAVRFGDPPAGGFSTTDLAVIYFLLFLFLASIVGYFWMIWDPKKQTLQDKLSGVIVVKKMPPYGVDH